MAVQPLNSGSHRTLEFVKLTKLKCINLCFMFYASFVLQLFHRFDPVYNPIEGVSISFYGIALLIRCI